MQHDIVTARLSKRKQSKGAARQTAPGAASGHVPVRISCWGSWPGTADLWGPGRASPDSPSRCRPASKHTQLVTQFGERKPQEGNKNGPKRGTGAATTNIFAKARFLLNAGPSTPKTAFCLHGILPPCYRHTCDAQIFQQRSVSYSNEGLLKETVKNFKKSRANLYESFSRDSVSRKGCANLQTTL